LLNVYQLATSNRLNLAIGVLADAYLILVKKWS